MQTPREPLADLVGLIPKPADVLELNAGTLSPTPLPVQHAVERLRQMQSTSPTHFWAHAVGPLAAEARAALGRFLNARPPDLFLLPNVTAAMNVAVSSIAFEPGDEILTTDHEYGAMGILLDHVARRDGANVRTIALPQESATPAEIVRLFREAVTDRTRVVFFSHVSSPTALRLPAAEIVAATKSDRRLVIVDGAHAPGMFPVDLTAIAADAYGANCHKWMMSPAGAGFLHASPRLKAVLRPSLQSWGEEAATSDTALHDAPWRDPRSGQDHGATRLQFRMEYQGVCERSQQLAVGSAVAFVERVGLDRIEARWRELSAYLCNQLPAETGLKVASPAEEACRSAMTVFAVNDAQATELRRRLFAEHKVIAPVTSAAGRSYFRVSTAWFNTEAEIDRLVSAVKAVLRG